MDKKNEFFILTSRCNDALNHLTAQSKMKVIDAVVNYKADGTDPTNLNQYLMTIFHLVIYSIDLEAFIEGIYE